MNQIKESGKCRTVLFVCVGNNAKMKEKTLDGVGKISYSSMSEEKAKVVVYL